ncbi:MAG: hypothetical protein Q7W45_00245 [Bacteroidota bacterium]|nr:hypothetical protein [Bacteroidota bacterium]MDP3146146.1 hypothetical protein [Bacteroidota bacterium]
MKSFYFTVVFLIALTSLAVKPDFNAAANLAFVPNMGQIITDKNTPASMVHFKASVSGLEFYLTDSGISYVFVKHNRDLYDAGLGGSPNPNFTPTTEYGRIDMTLENAVINKNTVVKEFPSQAKYNYYYAQCAEGAMAISGYHKLTYKNVYPNIDWVITSDSKKHLKYEFIVHPGGNPSQIKMEYKYAEINVTPNAITLTSPMGEIKEQNLYVYIQETNASVPANYVQNGNIVSINTQAPVGQTLIIDPPLYWSTYWGSAGSEQTQALVTSGVGEFVFIAGYTSSTTFPTTNPGSGTYYQGVFGGNFDAFITKFDTNGVHFWSTYYGGSGSEGSTSYTGISIACGAGNDLWLVGTTNSTNLPIQNAGSGAYYQATLGGGYDFFVVKFNYAGVRQHATYVGGSLDDGGLSHGNGADCDPSGNLYFSGRILSANFPLLNPGGGAYFDNTLNGGDDLCIVKFSQGCQMLWSTILGGSGDDMNYSMDLHVDRINSKLYVGTCSNSTNLPTVNPGGSFYFDNTNNGGTDMYLTRFSFGGLMEWGTYIGGSGEEWLSMSVISAPDGDIGMITLTGSTNMPCVNPGGSAFFDNTHNGGTWDMYLCRFEQNGVMSWSTYYGSSNNEHCQHNITMDANGNIIMCGVSDGAAAPPTFNPANGSYYNGVKDAQGTYCLVQFSPAGVMLWGTFWGGSGHDHLLGAVGACIGVSAHSDIFVTGETNSTNLPMLNPGFGAYFDNTANGGQDGFIAKFNNDIIPVPLPIELLGFSCEPSPIGIEINWVTANEINNHHFTIERTSDGENYETIGTVKGSLNSYATHHYNYVDKTPLNGVNYYRLSQTNTSGSEKTFNLIACNHEDDKGEVLMNIYSMTGQLIYSARTNDYRVALKSAEIAIGVYLVELVEQNSKTNFKHLVTQ